MEAFNLGSSGEVTSETVKDLIAAYKNEKVLNPAHVSKILDDVEKLFKTEKNLVDVTVAEGKHVNVYGNIAGQFYDMVNMFEKAGIPSAENPSVFLGNYVDRGYFGVEVIVTLFALKILYPNQVTICRGNHETTAINTIYGFHDEIKYKYSENMNLFERFNEVFNTLPLGAVISDDKNKIMAVHGGLTSEEHLKLSDIQSLERFREVEPKGMMTDILWSDPHDEQGIKESPRGCSIIFGPDVTKSFLDENGLSYIIRTHQLQMEGYHEDHDGKCISVWSAPNYCDKCGNKGSVIHLTGGDMSPKHTLFDSVPHPEPKYSMPEPVIPQHLIKK